ncbi:MAG: hypothetical protein LUQ07_05745, partial [Methanospirillum sp.]|nr:hypothetical protein [Methanospirillum sp.]
TLSSIRSSRASLSIVSIGSLNICPASMIHIRIIFQRDAIPFGGLIDTGTQIVYQSFGTIPR